MSDTTTPGDGGVGTIVDVADIPEDELPAEDRDELQWLTNGAIRCRTGGVWYYLRRPNFGELKKLHEHMESLRDESAAWVEEARLNADRLAKELRQISQKLQAVETDENTDPEDEATTAQVHELTVQLVKTQREQQRAISNIKVYTWGVGEKWWREVFKVLRVREGPQVPKHMPSWVANSGLPDEALKHWMRVPLGRGGPLSNGQ